MLKYVYMELHNLDLPQVGCGKVINTLTRHTKRVNSVKWIKGIDCELELVSGSADHSAIVWSLAGDEYRSHLLEGHQGSVNVVEALYKDTSARVPIILTASTDSTVKIWTRLHLNGKNKTKYVFLIFVL